MEFKSLKNIETSFKQIRLFTLVVVCLCALLAGYSVWSAYSFAEAQRQKIYVLDGGKSLMLALSQDLSQNRPAEAKEHVRRFHELFFTLSPDKSAIEGNISRALLLADKRTVKHIGSKAFGIQYLLKGVYSHNGLLYFHTELRNKSNVPFDIDFITFKIVDKKVVKQTTMQEHHRLP